VTVVETSHERAEGHGQYGGPQTKKKEKTEVGPLSKTTKKREGGSKKNRAFDPNGNTGRVTWEARGWGTRSGTRGVGVGCTGKGREGGDVVG